MRNTFRKLNISKALIMKGVSLVVVFATLVSAYAAFSMNATLGWFSKNNTVTANGMITQAYQSTFRVTYIPVELTRDPNEPHAITGKTDIPGEKQTVITKDTEMLNGLRVPGQSKAFDITITNIGAYPVTLTSFGFDAPGVADDVPKYLDGKLCYLSTELATRLVLTSEGKMIEAAHDDNFPGRYLREETDGVAGVAGQIDFFDWLEENTTIVLNPKESVTFTIEITFVDDGNNQNVFKNFAENGGTCRRRIFLAYDE